VPVSEPSVGASGWDTWGHGITTIANSVENAPSRLDALEAASAKIPASVVDAKGDLLAATANDTVTRLGVGTDGQVLTASSGASTGLAWATPTSGGSSSMTSNTQAGTSYTLVLGDAGKAVEMTSSSANTVTVPPNSSVAFPTGTILEITQVGVGKTTVTRGSGVTFDPPLIAMNQYSTVRLRKRATDEWVVTGDTGIVWRSSAPFASWSDPAYSSGAIVNNNIWNTGPAGPQTVYAAAWNNWAVVSTQPGTGADDGVMSYPDTQVDVSRVLSGLTTLPSTFNVTTPSAGGAVPSNGPQWNAAYDLWCNGFTKEIMIWNNWTANWQFYYSLYSGVQITVDGVVYNAWNNGSGGTWFVRQTVTNVGSVDIAHVLSAAITRGWLLSTDTLNHIEYGFEINYTGVPLAFVVNDFTV
jgi:hypothetical protein